MLLSLVCRLVRCLLGLLAVLVQSDLSKDAELLALRHESQVLRRQLQLILTRKTDLSRARVSSRRRFVPSAGFDLWVRLPACLRFGLVRGGGRG